MNKKYKVEGFVGIIISVLIGLITLYTQSQDPKTGIIFFLALLGVIILYFSITYVVETIKSKVSQMDHNSELIVNIRKNLNTLEDKLNYNKALERLNIRLSTMENLFKMKNKRGTIDPRWVILIVMIILFYFFLKAHGYI
jgi:Mn2+/Fe2+ NRAMP family transporter